MVHYVLYTTFFRTYGYSMVALVVDLYLAGLGIIESCIFAILCLDPEPNLIYIYIIIYIYSQFFSVDCQENSQKHWRKILKSF